MSMLHLVPRRTVARRPAAVVEECAHRELVPRLDASPDFGLPDLVASYTCKACKSIFTPEEAKALRI